MNDLPLALFEKYLVEAVSTAFSTQAGIQLTLEPTDKPVLKGDLISTIGFSSSQATGSFSLIFSAPTFLKILNSMLGENETKITESNADAASELLNIVYGLARPRMNKHEFDFLPAIPSVVTGTDLSMSQTKSGNSFSYTAKTSVGDFFVSGSFVKRPSDQKG